MESSGVVMALHFILYFVLNLHEKWVCNLFYKRVNFTFFFDRLWKIFPEDLKFLKNVIIVCKQIQFDMPNMTCFLFSHARDLHAKFKAHPEKNTWLKRCPFCPFCRISTRKSPLNFILLSLSWVHDNNWPTEQRALRFIEKLFWVPPGLFVIHTNRIGIF